MFMRLGAWQEVFWHSCALGKGGLQEGMCLGSDLGTLPLQSSLHRSVAKRTGCGRNKDSTFWCSLIPLNFHFLKDKRTW